jgi:hypothetical protein
MAKAEKSMGMTTKKISRADVRAATLLGLKMVRSDPASVKITSGQRHHIVKSK